MQKIQTNVKDPRTGKESEQSLNVLQTYCDGGNFIHLFDTGIYGYGDGAPVKTREELETMISDPLQKRRALNWWDHIGEGVSRAYYKEVEARLNRILGDYSPDAVKQSDRDAALYYRLPRGEKNVPDGVTPQPWTSYFKERPPWWDGVTEEIVYKNYRYLLAFSDDSSARDKAAGKGSKPVKVEKAGKSGDTRSEEDF